MEDEKIIGLYWERNEDAITETSSKYGKLFFRIASNILLNHEDSEECVNDTYLGLWNESNLPLYILFFVIAMHSISITLIYRVLRPAE